MTILTTLIRRQTWGSSYVVFFRPEANVTNQQTTTFQSSCQYFPISFSLLKELLFLSDRSICDSVCCETWILYGMRLQLVYTNINYQLLEFKIWFWLNHHSIYMHGCYIISCFIRMFHKWAKLHWPLCMYLLF